MSRGILFIGGAHPRVEYVHQILKDIDVVGAADSGYDSALACGIKPQWVVGDMDSIAHPDQLQKLPSHAVDWCSQEKDETDTELGMMRLNREGCTSSILIGGGEGRLDHTLALTKLFLGEWVPDAWYTAYEWVSLLHTQRILRGSAGHRLSLFPIGNGPWKVHSKGLQWPVDSVDWQNGGYSLSNCFLEERIELYGVQGLFLVMRPIEEALANS